MPSYRIHRLRESQRAQFRFAPHVSGVTQIKPKDYEPANRVEAAHPYAAWSALRETGDALKTGDLLENEGGDLRILKYIGFEEARWIVPEAAAPLPESIAAPAESQLDAG